jgi:hypothetical protein
MPRCGTPDGIPDMDRSNKFSVEPSTGLGLPHPPATYTFADTGERGDRVLDAIYTGTSVTDQTIIPAANPDLTISYMPRSPWIR